MKRPDRSTAVIVCLLAVAMALPVLYVLSVGPVMALVVNEVLPEEMLAIYGPLRWTEQWDPAQRLIWWYIGLWVNTFPP